MDKPSSGFDSAQPTGEGAGELAVAALLALRFECEAELRRLRLTWKSPRLKAFYRAATGLPDAILADVPAAALASLLKKLKEEPTP